MARPDREDHVVDGLTVVVEVRVIRELGPDHRPTERRSEVRGPEDADVPIVLVGEPDVGGGRRSDRDLAAGGPGGPGRSGVTTTPSASAEASSALTAASAVAGAFSRSTAPSPAVLVPRTSSSRRLAVNATSLKYVPARYGGSSQVRPPSRVRKAPSTPTAQT